jgi:triphosphatase
MHRKKSCGYSDPAASASYGNALTICVTGFGTAVVMSSQKELEIKLQVDPPTLRRLGRIPLIKTLNKLPKHANEASVYFDTDKHKLRKKGLMLRVRRIGKRHVQTIKAAGNSATIDRNEWETEILGAEPDFGMIRGTPLEGLVSKKMRRRLKPMFETRIRRSLYSLADDERTIELTIDRGKIDTGDGSVPVCELELELKRGSKARLFEDARTLMRALAAQISLKSKAERAYEFIDGEEGLPVKAAPVHLATGCHARDGFKVIGFACLKQVVDNVPALTKGDPEGVHQMRVGVRRLRAAMSLFGTILPGDQTVIVKNELKWLAGELTPAREFEVLNERVKDPVNQHRGKRGNGLLSFSKALSRKHKAALARAKETAKSVRFRVLTFDVAAWLELGHWTQPQDDLVRSRGQVPIEVFAAEQLQRRYRKVRKRGKKIAQLDAKKRHKLRIQVKKMRYAAEFFGELFQSKKAVRRQKKFSTALKRLQDGLGDLNDLAVDERLIARARSPNSAFAAGLLTGREEARENEAMSAAIEGYTKLAKVRPFWR